ESDWKPLQAAFGNRLARQPGPVSPLTILAAAKEIKCSPSILASIVAKHAPLGFTLDFDPCALDDWERSSDRDQQLRHYLLGSGWRWTSKAIPPGFWLTVYKEMKIQPAEVLDCLTKLQFPGTNWSLNFPSLADLTFDDFDLQLHSQGLWMRKRISSSYVL